MRQSQSDQAKARFSTRGSRFPNAPPCPINVLLPEQGTQPAEPQSSQAGNLTQSGALPRKNKHLLWRQKEKALLETASGTTSPLWVPEVPNPKVPIRRKVLREEWKSAPRLAPQARALTMHQPQAKCQAQHDLAALFLAWLLTLRLASVPMTVKCPEVPVLPYLPLAPGRSSSPCGLCHPPRTQRCCSCGRSPFLGAAATDTGPGGGDGEIEA